MGQKTVLGLAGIPEARVPAPRVNAGGRPCAAAGLNASGPWEGRSLARRTSDGFFFFFWGGGTGLSRQAGSADPAGGRPRRPGRAGEGGNRPPAPGSRLHRPASGPGGAGPTGPRAPPDRPRCRYPLALSSRCASFRSQSVIISTSAGKLVEGSQPSSRLALVASPSSRSTSAGRK